MKVVGITAGVWVVFAYLLSAPPSRSSPPALAYQSSIEVKRDDFSGATLVRLRDASIVNEPEHALTIQLETKVNDRSPAARMLSEEPRADATLTSFSPKGRDFGDRELHFLIDGRPLRIGVAAESPAFRNPDVQAKSLVVGSRIHAVIRMADLRRIVTGKDVRMRLGWFEADLNSNVLGSLRSFVNAADGETDPVKKEGER